MGVVVLKTITVLLATYDGEAYLPCQLGSLQQQTDEDFVVLMQDDGSTDATPALLSNACATDSRFRLGSQNGHHLGPVGNFWSLLRQCDTPYCAFCDQDDEWLP